MTQLDVSFEEPAWVQTLQRMSARGHISVAMLLTLMEGEDEQALEDAFLYLESGKITLDISTLPRISAAGQAAVRLRREEELVKSGTLRCQLEENDPLRLYLQEVEALPKPADLQAMALRFAGGYEQVMPALTNGMLPTVIDMACGLTGHGVLLMDLIQEGSLGLWQGILSYRQGDFAQDARWWIAQYMAKAVFLQARENGVGQKLKQAMEDYRSADEWLLSQLGQNATLEQIAQHIHLSVEETKAARDMLESARLLQQAHHRQTQPSSDEEEQAVEDTAYFRLRQRVGELLSTLEDDDARLLSLRFGLEGGTPMSPEKVGEKMQLTPEEVLAREAAALDRLRKEG